MPDNIANIGGQPNGGQSQSGSNQQGASGTEGGQSQGSGTPAAPAGQGATGDGVAQGTPAGASGQPAGNPGAGAGSGGTDPGGAASQTPGSQTPAAGQQPPVVTPDWPTDWRQKLAGADDKDGKVMKQLERFASPGDLLRSYNELQGRLSQVKTPLPANATPEQLSTWRKEQGIPESAEKYDMTMPDGLVIGENDKTILTPILGEMHTLNLTADQAKGVVAAYKKQEALFLRQAEENRTAAKQQTEDTLRKEWGEEYRAESNRIENMMQTWTAEARAAVNFGYDDKGMPLKSNVQFMRDLAVQARIINPVSTITNGGGGNQMTSVETEIAGIETRMGTDRDAYFKDEKAQARYRELLSWRENNKPRNQG